MGSELEPGAAPFFTAPAPAKKSDSGSATLVSDPGFFLIPDPDLPKIRIRSRKIQIQIQIQIHAKK